MIARIFAAVTPIARACVLRTRLSSFSRPHVVALQTLRLLASGMVWLAATGAAVANETDAATLLKLRHAGEVSCQPTLPYFCENMHVRCSGQTSVPAFQFRLRTTSSATSLELTAAPEEFQRRYESANVEWAEDGSYVLLWPKAANGYVKLLPDGKYVFRHYIQGLGVMSLGQCR